MRTIPILNALKNTPQIERFVPYLLDKDLQVEKKFPSAENLSSSGYNMEDFAADNKLVMAWFSKLQQQFNEWRNQQYSKPVAPVNLAPTGSRSYNASYTESDLECAIVSENFDDFLDFCRYLNIKYGTEHNFISLKTLAGLPLLIIKGQAGFSCPELSNIYPGKTLPQLEVTFRHPNVHQIIQEAGIQFFAELDSKQLESYVFNKRYIELMLKNTPSDATFEGEPLKKVLEAFKGALSAALKCLPSGTLQDTPPFNKDVFANAIKPKSSLSEAMALGITLYKQPNQSPNNPSQLDVVPKF
ncbi:Uncharacterised protein [Legionella busanensis]|uniref:Uncharacterized protein n=1 Tax=Legionella busanensis TaxID=190655 RepID=A0A378JIN3_9GAMM|nr:hypothetical protein [Legionella busanensis]STX50907.1 Uncharacterised protein [Legionella busanensis]